MHAALLAVQIMFASLAVAAKLALVEIPRFGLIAFRTPAAALILIAIRALLPWERVAWRDLPALALFALFGITANQLLFIAGLEHTTATNAVVLGASIPVFTVGVAVVLRRERATLAKLVGLAIALSGALWLVGADRFSTEGEGGRWLGNLLILANSLCFSIYLVISRPILARYRTITVITWIMCFGALGVLPFGAHDLWTHAPSLSRTTWLAMWYIVLFPTVGSYFLNGYALKRAPSSLVAAYIYVQPLMGALMAAVALHERPSGATIISALSIGVGVWLVARAR